MKPCVLSCILFLMLEFSLAQSGTIDFARISFDGMAFTVQKQQVITKFGKPTIHYPNYECGYHADNWQDGRPYYQLKYAGFTYIGSDKEGFVLEKVNFDSIGKIQLQYGQMTWSGQTTKEQIIKFFGEQVRSKFTKDERGESVLIYSTSTDDGVVLTFKNGKLTQFEYWSPC